MKIATTKEENTILKRSSFEANSSDKHWLLILKFIFDLFVFSLSFSVFLFAFCDFHNSFR